MKNDIRCPALEITHLGSHHETFASYKRRAIKAAKELFYGKDVVRRLKLCTTEGEIEHIMHDARKGD